MKKFLGVMVIAGVMAVSGAAMAGTGPSDAKTSEGFAAGYGRAAAMANMGQGENSANQIIFNLAYAAASKQALTAGGNEEKLEDWTGRQKKADVECSGITYLHRPLWQRIMSFGILGAVEEATEYRVWSAPGGTDAIKFLLRRNPEFRLLIAQGIRFGVPEAFASAFNCTSSIGGDVEFLYTMNNGLAHLQITVPE